MSIQIFAGVVFVLGYIAIALEHPLKVSKAAIALLIGGALWIIVALNGVDHLRLELLEAGGEIFELIVFLLAAMSLIEILLHYQFFDVIRGKLFALRLSEKQQFLIISLIAFFLSAVIDNLTTTIVMIQIARKFFKGENLLIAVAGIVIAANAGGAFSPIGDVTTIMLWLGGKFGTFEIIWKAVLPALVLFGIAAAFLASKIKQETPDETNEVITRLGRSEKLIIGLVFTAFTFPIIMNFIGLPPYLGLLLGLALVWLAVETIRQIRPKETHLGASIEEFIKRTDIPSLKFFIGILLAVSALHALGVLTVVSEAIFGPAPEAMRVIGGNVLLGFLSAIVDNVPLTAIAMEILHAPDTSFWVLLALTAGTGGSLLIVGSAAGVVAMGMVKELTFIKYFKIAFVPALVGFLAAVGVWSFQYFMLGW
ncbi:MAG: sodium:proton antiporter NhaD [Candidatus Wildermuthbacteria bacterium]|nr:sodium:proton antiporter NhaD [Candidatus Wildermuthbacteria bacterium]